MFLLLFNPYIVNLLDDGICCPVPNCRAHSSNPYIIRRHLCIRHSMDHFQVIGKTEFVQCPRCGIFLIHLTPEHFQSQFCNRQSARRHRVQSHEHCSAIAAALTPFHIGEDPIEFVSNFRYLGRILSADDSDDMAAYVRKEKAARVWGRFKALLQNNGASVEAMGRFYRTIMQQTHLFVSETWILSNRALNRLDRFHARCARGITHRHIQQLADGTWEYPPTHDVLEACHIQPLSVYIQRRRHTLFEHYAAHHSVLYQQCLNTYGTTPRSLTWWNLDMHSPS